MPIKVIALLKRKHGLDDAELRAYYESRHVPLILSIAPQIRDYRRNYLAREGAILATGARWPDFDVVTELWFDDPADYAAAMAAFTAPENAARIAADEENVFDRSRTMFFVVEECGGRSA